MVRPGGRIYEQREAVAKELQKIDGLSFVKNSSAFYIFPRLDAKKFRITDDKKFAEDLLNATDILLVPGSGFDWQQPDHFRVVYLPRIEILKECAEKITDFFSYYRQH